MYRRQQIWIFFFMPNKSTGPKRIEKTENAKKISNILQEKVQILTQYIFSAYANRCTVCVLFQIIYISGMIAYASMMPLLRLIPFIQVVIILLHKQNT